MSLIPHLVLQGAVWGGARRLQPLRAHRHFGGVMQALAGARPSPGAHTGPEVAAIQRNGILSGSRTERQDCVILAACRALWQLAQQCDSKMGGQAYMQP